jgi:hypothetical protein
MNALTLQTLLELKLLIRLRWPLLFPPAAGLWMLVQLSNFSGAVSQDLYLHLINSQVMFHTLSLGLPVFLGILLIRRDVLNPMYQWTHSLPVSNLAFIMSKFAAGLLYMGMIIAFVDAVYLIQAVRSQLPLLTGLLQLKELNLLYLWSYGISLALGITIGTLLPSRFALPIGFCAWLFGSVFLQIFITEQNGWYPLKAFYLNHLLTTTMLDNEVWGPALAAEEYGYMRLFVAAFGLFLLLWSAAALGTQRAFGVSRRAALIAAAAFLVACAAYVPYAQLWNQRFSHLDEIASVSSAMADIKPQERYAFKIDSMKLDIVKEGGDMLSVDALIGLPTKDGMALSAIDSAKPWTDKQQGRLTFLLHPSFRVDKVALNGKSVRFIRSGDTLSIDAASLTGGGQQQTVRIVYRGRLNEWTYSSFGKGKVEAYSAFVKGDNLYLPGRIGWYPLPGGDSLFYRDGSTLYGRLNAAQQIRADFDVRMHGFDAPLFASIAQADDDRQGDRHFQQNGASAFSLFGGTGFIEVSSPGEPVTIVTTPSNRKESERFLQELARARSYFEGWLERPADPLQRIVYFPSYLIRANANSLTEQQIGNLLFIPELMYNHLDSYMLDRVMSQLLFGDINQKTYSDNTSAPVSIVQEIRQAVLGMYTLETGDSANAKTAPVSSLSPEPPNVGDRLQTMIRDAVVQGRIEQVKRTLRYFYNDGLTIRVKEEEDAWFDKGMKQEQYPVITLEDWLKVWNQSAKEAVPHDR